MTRDFSTRTVVAPLGEGGMQHSPLAQPELATTQVSELTVLTITSTHCGGVPTRIEIADQLPSSPYLRDVSHASSMRETFTYHCKEGVTLKAVGVLIVHEIKDTTTPSSHVLRTEIIVEVAVACLGE